MKQQDATKLLAALMILIMIIVPVAYMVTGPAPDNERTGEEEFEGYRYNPEFWTVNEPFESISDALNMTPYGVVNARYADIEIMTPQMIQWAKGELPIDDVNSLYKSNTTRLFYAEMKNNSFLLLSTMFPEKNDFEYIVYPNLYYNHYILMRQDTGAINVMGYPVIYGPSNSVEDVLQIISSLNRTATAYDQFEGLLSMAEPAPYQFINSNVSFADQFYMGIREVNGSYERINAYLNVNSSTLKKIKQLQTNSTEKGFTEYNITQRGNYTAVKIVSDDLLRIIFEEAY